MSQLDHHKPIFKNLDGIRFIAFLGVFISHCFYPRSTEAKESDLFKSISFFAGDSRWGDLGLYIFFVMSGFLITYLLIQEQQVFGKVHAPGFYMRRVLRIWPLYFLLVGLNFLLYPKFTHQPVTGDPVPYILFFENFEVIKHGFDNGIAGHLWAVSIEEQFYLLLPLIMLVVPIRFLHYVFVAVIILAQGFRIVHYQDASILFHHSISASFDIALGGLSAWLIFFNDRFKNFISNLSRATICLIYILSLTVLFLQEFIFKESLFIVGMLILQLFAAFLLLEQNYAKHSLVKVGNLKWVSMLGKYAYGFYCYHILWIRFSEVVGSKLNVKGLFGEIILIPLMGLVLTILIGIGSYHLFEIHFLNLKKKFSYLN